MPMWKVEQCMEMFFCSTSIYLLLHYSMLSTVICLFFCSNFLSGSNKISLKKLICSKFINEIIGILIFCMKLRQKESYSKLKKTIDSHIGVFHT